ncbi:MAG TPA: hypothetical protein VMI53_12855, partial [Opitutaceae bacterium]|nr:hypothetical protein [Opitutaceae bacterium]
FLRYFQPKKSAMTPAATATPAGSFSRRSRSLTLAGNAKINTRPGRLLTALAFDRRPPHIVWLVL